MTCWNPILWISVPSQHIVNGCTQGRFTYKPCCSLDKYTKPGIIVFKIFHCFFRHFLHLLSSVFRAVASSCLDCHKECFLCCHVKSWELGRSPDHDFTLFIPVATLPFLGAVLLPFLYLLFSGSCQVWCPLCSITECPAWSPKPMMVFWLDAA